MRELREMQPFWTHAVRLDNASLVEVIGLEPQTPLDEALQVTLAARGRAGELVG
jgi:hypothetical protein